MAAKPKSKLGPMDTRATESDRNVWEFTTGAFAWQYHALGLGLNLLIRAAGDESRPYTPSLYTRTLDHAILFANGFEGGWEAGRKALLAEQAKGKDSPKAG
jgi:hypothetical protein